MKRSKAIQRTARSTAEMEALTADIRSEVAQAERHFGHAVTHAIRAGELLIEAKTRLRRGEWGPWAGAELPRDPSGRHRLHADGAQPRPNRKRALDSPGTGAAGAAAEDNGGGSEDRGAASAAAAMNPWAALEALKRGEPREQDFAQHEPSWERRAALAFAQLDHARQVQRALPGLLADGAQPDLPPDEARAFAKAGERGLRYLELEHRAAHEETRIPGVHPPLVGCI